MAYTYEQLRERNILRILSSKKKERRYIHMYAKLNRIKNRTEKQEQSFKHILSFMQRKVKNRKENGYKQIDKELVYQMLKSKINNPMQLNLILS